MAKSPLYFVIWKEGKRYVSQCLNVDVSSFGDTKDEAMQNLNEALELYFEDGDAMTHELIENPEIVAMPSDYA